MLRVLLVLLCLAVVSAMVTSASAELFDDFSGEQRGSWAPARWWDDYACRGQFVVPGNKAPKLDVAFSRAQRASEINAAGGFVIEVDLVEIRQGSAIIGIGSGEVENAAVAVVLYGDNRPDEDQLYVYGKSWDIGGEFNEGDRVRIEVDTDDVTERDAQASVSVVVGDTEVVSDYGFQWKKSPLGFHLGAGKGRAVFDNLRIAPAAVKMPPSAEKYATEPVRYVGKVQTDKRFYDGAVRHAVGAHRYQAFRANRTHPSEGGDVGWTYNHQPFLAYWNGTFYIQYLSNLVEEHNPPGRTLLVTSKDGRSWSNPEVIFPEYPLPEIRRGETYIPKGTPSVMHQRMGFYVAPNGRLLTLAFYSYCANPRTSPNAGTGLGRVVREIYKAGGFGPIYFIRYNRHAGFNENNTLYPFYKTSTDKGFLDACEALLADKLITLQWWEEDRAKDGFFTIDPGDVKKAFQFSANMTTFKGAGKAFCFYHRPDGVVVGIWKNQWSALSPDDGKTWMPITKNSTLKTCGAKVWGQRTEDGRYSLVYNHSATRGNRYPMVVMTSNDGHKFDNMLCLEGEVPPMRYQGIHKSRGPQYIRGIVEGNGTPPGKYMWNTFSVNKEDIWVSRLTVPVRGTVEKHVNQDFEKAETEADLDLWNLHMPKWAPISIASDPHKPDNGAL